MRLRSNGAESELTATWCDTTVCEEHLNGARRYVLSHAGERTDGLTVKFYALDHLRSIRDVTDGTGALVAHYTYEPWGRPISSIGEIVSPVAFAGSRVDEEGALHVTLFRQYDATLGRWLSEDPLFSRGEYQGASGAQNRYAYVSNAPIRFIDVLGLSAGEPGPRNPSQKIRCYWRDSCETLQWKMQQFGNTIRDHQAWDAAHQTDRHQDEIDDFVRGLIRCQTIYNAKCRPKELIKQCGQECVGVVGAILSASLACLLKMPVLAP